MNEVLVVYCHRRRHVLCKVVDEDGEYFVETPRYVAGRARATWTPIRRALDPGAGMRYGCGCGRSTLFRDKVLGRAIADGIREIHAKVV